MPDFHLTINGRSLYVSIFPAMPTFVILKLKSPNILSCRTSIVSLPAEFEPFAVAIQFGSFRKLENEDLAAKLRKWKFSGDQPQTLLYSSLSNDWTECLLYMEELRKSIGSSICLLIRVFILIWWRMRNSNPPDVLLARQVTTPSSPNPHISL